MKNIDIDRVLSSVQRLNPMQSVALRFNEQTGMVGLALLRNLLDENPKVQVPYIERSIMEAVITSHQWDMAKNRIYCVEGLSCVKKKLLRDILKYVDTADVDNRGMEGIMFGRKKRREEVVQQLSNWVFAPEFIKAVEEWGLYPRSYLSELKDGTPSMQIDLLMNNDIVTSLTLDGFSGRIAVDDVWGKDIYVTPGQFRQVIMSAIEHAVELVTGIG